MGKMMTRQKIVEILMQHNPDTKRASVDQYASCLISYLEAVENLERNGTIVAHPRTGTPIENPYLKVRTIAMADMRKCGALKGIAPLWEQLSEVSD